MSDIAKPNFHAGNATIKAQAARIEELERENERLREALTQERLENLWNAYNTGFEKEGEWCHSFMSDGEWLISEIGMDPTQGWYDAAEVKRRIPEAAARAALQGETGE